MKKFKGVYVEWYDHQGTARWCDTDTPGEIDQRQYLVVTLGLLVAENETTLTVSSGWCENDMVNGYTTIIKAVVKYRKWIKLPERKLP